MEHFKIIKPSTLLAPYVKHYWLLKSDDIVHAQRIIPSGNIELVFHRGYSMKCNEKYIPKTSLSGQSLSFIDLIPTGKVNMIAVVFHPFGAKAFFKLSVDELSNLIVSGDDLNIRLLKELEEKILNTLEDNSCIHLIESFLLKHFSPFKSYNYERMVVAVNTINSVSNTLKVSHLAEKLCLSPKQFQRIFIEHIGATPKDFIRIVRFHKALYTLQNNPAMSFTTLAYECGYYDQPHLNKEFKLFSGYTPSQYIATCNPYSDYFSY